MSRKKPRDCPPGEELARAFLKETSPGTGREILNHARRCPCCRPKLQVLDRVRAELEARADKVPETRLTGDETRVLRKAAVVQLRLMKRPGRPLSLRPVPVAAMVVVALIALALGYLYLDSTLHSRLAVRASMNRELRLLGPGARLREAPADFSWTDVPGRDEFRFVLIDDDLNTIYEMDTHSTGLRIPQDERQKLLKGKNYLWTVIALDDDDRELASASREFEIK